MPSTASVNKAGRIRLKIGEEEEKKDQSAVGSASVSSVVSCGSRAS